MDVSNSFANIVATMQVRLDILKNMKCQYITEFHTLSNIAAINQYQRAH